MRKLRKKKKDALSSFKYNPVTYGCKRITGNHWQEQEAHGTCWQPHSLLTAKTSNENIRGH